MLWFACCRCKRSSRQMSTSYCKRHRYNNFVSRNYNDYYYCISFGEIRQMSPRCDGVCSVHVGAHEFIGRCCAVKLQIVYTTYHIMLTSFDIVLHRCTQCAHCASGVAKVSSALRGPIFLRQTVKSLLLLWKLQLVLSQFKLLTPSRESNMIYSYQK